MHHLFNSSSYTFFPLLAEKREEKQTSYVHNYFLTDLWTKTVRSNRSPARCKLNFNFPRRRRIRELLFPTTTNEIPSTPLFPRETEHRIHDRSEEASFNRYSIRQRGETRWWYHYPTPCDKMKHVKAILGYICIIFNHYFFLIQFYYTFFSFFYFFFFQKYPDITLTRG